MTDHMHTGLRWSLLGLALLFGVGLLFLGGCTTPTIMPTPTVTRTPKPTLTPTPSPTLTPSPTPTPAFPVTVGCSERAPDAVCARLQARVAEDPTHFVWSDVGGSQIVLDTIEQAGGVRVGTWTLAVAAPFFTVDDDVTVADLRGTWEGSAAGPFELHPLLVTTDTLETLLTLWGPPAESVVQQASPDDLLAEAESVNGWVILPFDALDPGWKVLRVDGISLLEKGTDLQPYPFQVPLYLYSETRPETLPLLNPSADSFSNRDESRMTLVVMTGVTAMTRATGQLMDRMGVTYPARDIQHWFADADFVHISNEVSFKPDCVAEGSGSMSFCSHDSYIELLEAVNANIIELTGNHLEDKGNQWLNYSLDMYRERGWSWFGGGANQLEGSLPLTLTHNGNQIAFIGCNTVGPFADETSAGAARCDFPMLYETIGQLREEGFQPIVTLQYLEDYNYAPTPAQMRDFRALAEAGAVVVQGSQAHQAQTLEFYGETFIHYGLGNFFFDQMWSDGTRQEFVDRLTFYDGRLLSIDLRTAILEEYGRPRPMTVGDALPAADRRQFLQMIFDLRP